ncbi:MAG: hypothetical protein R6X19_06715 [Kiritimatiellia bacterium]
MAAPIPGEWKRAVLAILKEGHSKRIEVRLQAVKDFQALFPGAFTYEIYDAFSEGLNRPDLEGNRVYGMVPKGETYEFIFNHRKKDLYGKVCLTTDGRVVVVFSAHEPRKGSKL